MAEPVASPGREFDVAAFDRALAAESQPVALFRDTLARVTKEQRSAFLAGTPASLLVPRHAAFIDAILERAWSRYFAADEPDIALIAVGGYGRGELHLGSDIDLMILLRGDDHERYRERIEPFVTFLWDIGLEVGHSVRSLAECSEQSASDITIETNLLEARLLCGPGDLFAALGGLIRDDSVWTSRRYFEEKLAEQKARHARYHDTGYNLEPNVKESPGGLRDIQMIGWVSKRHFAADTLHDLVDHEFLTEEEYATLIEGQAFLWQVRFALHVLAERREDRLLFDYQRTIAEQFGYHDEEDHLGVEQFMKQYYRVVMELSRLNEMLLQLFQETILFADDHARPQPLNRRFQVRHRFLEAVDDQVFVNYPFALLELFLLMQQHPELKGVRASTIRLVRSHRHLIDDEFRADVRARSLFMEILRQPQGITHELRRMNRYGVLAAYLPAFGAVVGLMQYDLFHVYTVDEHTLRVVRNLRRFAVPEHHHEFPRCSQIIQTLPKIELLYLAGLFHDIAKGRGGDHSKLGASDAEQFCRDHYLGRYDTQLVTWLVDHHLAMSRTAQREDTSDPDVINSFANLVADQVRLDYLYLLTVADIRATNPTLWTSWKETLLAELYTSTKRALRRGLEHPLDAQERIRGVSVMARALLKARQVPDAAVDAIWSGFSEEYFLRHKADEIAWHTQLIASHDAPDRPLIAVRQEGSRGGTEIFVYTRDAERLFAQTTSILEQLGLTVADARIISSRTGHTLDSYVVLDDSGAPIEADYRLDEIRERLEQGLCAPGSEPHPVARRTPRHLQHFPMPTRVDFSSDIAGERTVVELIAADRPGLLSRIGQAFARCGARVQNAKIGTFGNRAEDVFYITDEADRPITDPEHLEVLRKTLLDALETNGSAKAKAERTG
ncbi:MAG: [protein-PII] uridylyltransferase [Gammaproteobacteria bacterium]|nr:[protein-PII] uridylyltransferase [Gammaproteobacteria bacterium]